MEELIKIEEKEGKRLVSARELYEKLKVQQDFSDWIKKQLENVDAVENTDFTRFPFKKEGNNATLIEYALTTDIAKEICMIVGIAPRTNEETRTLSKQFRRYFIECERQLQQVKQEISLKDQLALKVFHGGIDAIEAHKQLVEMETKPLLEKIEEDKPMVDFAEQVSKTSTTILVRTFAKLVKDENINLGEKKLYAWLRNNKYLTQSNEPMQRYVDMGLFVVKERVIKTPYGNKVETTTYITGKGQIYLMEKLRAEFK